MDKKKFLEISDKLIEEIHNQEISWDAIYYVKNALVNYPNEQEVIDFKDKLINIFQTPLLKPELWKALNLPTDHLPHLRNQEVTRNLPFKTVNDPYFLFYRKLISIDNIPFGPPPTFYETLIEFFKIENKCLISPERQKKLLDFVEKNQILVKSNKSQYYSYNEEINHYIEYRKKITTIDIEEGIDEYIEQDSENEFVALGKIGEIFLYNIILRDKDAYNTIFTAKEIGNGFGYDIYYQSLVNGQIIENLIEVKTTTKNDNQNLKEDDSFILTENEYNVMLEAKENNANYLIARVLFDNVQNVPIDYCYLQLCDDNVLRSLDFNDNVIEYGFTPLNNYGYTCTRKQNNKVKKI